MNENMSTNVQLEATANGTVSFATDVVATIAGLAATEVDGVASMYAGPTGIADILTRRNVKNLTKGVKVEVQDGKVTVDVTFVVEYGTPVPDVARSIQENVKKAIETMSGLTVEAVDVHVQGVSFERENKATAEIEQQQKVLLQKQEEPEQNKPAEEAEANEKPVIVPETETVPEEEFDENVLVDEEGEEVLEEAEDFENIPQDE